MTTLHDLSTRSAHTSAPTRTKKLFVLIACEESQAECIAFRQLGRIAYSCDLQPCRPNGHPEWHIQGDCRPFLDGVSQFTTQDGTQVSVPRWDLIICHPPCTYLCKVSSVHMAKWIDGECWLNEKRLQKMHDAAEEFVRSSRGKYRSHTFPELADAIARQRSAYILDDFAKKTCMVDL